MVLVVLTYLPLLQGMSPEMLAQRTHVKTMCPKLVAMSQKKWKGPACWEEPQAGTNSKFIKGISDAKRLAERYGVLPNR